MDVSVPIKLDTSTAVDQWQKFVDKVTTDDLRPNQALEDFFSGIEERTESASKAVKKFQLDMQRLAMSAKSAPFAMNMGALSSSAVANAARSRALTPMARSRAYSNEHGRYVGNYEGARKSAYETSFQNRYLSGEIADGSLKKQIDATLKSERTADRLQRTQNDLLKQSRLMYRQAKYGRAGGALAHLYGENSEAFNRAGGMLGRGAGYAGIGVAGLAMSGFSGTVEGERFAREMRVLSLELAASFKPLMETITGLTRNTREKLQTLSSRGQDNLQTGGLAAAGGYLGYKVAGPRGALVGAALGGAVGEGMARNNARTRASQSFFQNNTDLAKMQGKDRLEEIERRKAKLRDEYSWFDRHSINPFGNDKQDEYFGKLRAIETYKQDAEKPAYARKLRPEEVGKTQTGMDGSGANPERRQLMITEGVGFASAGSTFFALQEDIIRTAAAETNKPIIDQLEKLNQNVEKLNR